MPVAMSFIVAATASRQISAASKALAMLSKLDAAVDNGHAEACRLRRQKQNRIEATLRSNANTIENQSAHAAVSATPTSHARPRT